VVLLFPDIRHINPARQAEVAAAVAPAVAKLPNIIKNKEGFMDNIKADRN
jgi:hypothetical protein